VDAGEEKFPDGQKEKGDDDPEKDATERKKKDEGEC